MACKTQTLSDMRGCLTLAVQRLNRLEKGLTSMQSPPEIDRGVFACRYTQTLFHGRPGLFLDRDGVIVEEVNYLHRVEDIVFIPGVAEAIARANQASIPVIMVTNQAGIGRGHFRWKDFHAVQHGIFRHCKAHSAHLDMVLACAYHAKGFGAYKTADHPWRKPRPGMLLEAARVMGSDLARSFIVGDCLSDLEAGHAAGLADGALVQTGHGSREWENGGEMQFQSWRESGQFMASRTDDAAAAIHRWLDELKLLK
jgi:D-glycero-D-manno-heptose 1,7-bisphosphate phosphatase